MSIGVCSPFKHHSRSFSNCSSLRQGRSLGENEECELAWPCLNSFSPGRKEKAACDRRRRKERVYGKFRTVTNPSSFSSSFPLQVIFFNTSAVRISSWRFQPQATHAVPSHTIPVWRGRRFFCLERLVSFVIFTRQHDCHRDSFERLV